MERNIREILAHLTQSQVDDYDTWLRVGMALHADGQSCSVWDEWSKRSPKYQDGACERHWKTFGNYSGTNVGIGSIIQMAKGNGYKPSDGFSWNDPIGRSNGRENALKAPNLELKEYLRALFKPGDTVNFVVSSFEKDGKFLPSGKGVNKGFDDLIKACDTYDDLGFILGDWNKKAGAWARINPMSGEGCKNSDVVEFRHCLIESDTLPKDEQLRKIRELNLPCSAIVDSGGKSIHAIVKIEAGNDEKLYRERVSKLHEFLAKNGFPVDKACKNPSRLSRIAAVTRNGKRQRLIATNTGMPSYQKWQDNCDIGNVISNTIDDFWNANANDMSDCLLGFRFLCTQCPWLIVAASGVGKSVLAMQMSILFATGRDLWKLEPHKPRKVILIQAENNFLDLVEPAQSITRILNLSEQEKADLRKNFRVVSDDTHSGEGFVRLLENICERYKPEIVIVDPLMAYIGGDISKQEVCTKFFRNGINPIIHKHNVGLIVLHHTGKQKAKDLKQFEANTDLEYLGIGSSDITNWARAVSIIMPSRHDKNIYEFKHVKRGRRTGSDPVIYLKQGSDHKDIFWYIAEKPAKVVRTQKGEGKYNPNTNPIYEKLGLEQMSPISKTKLFEHIKNKLASLGEPCADSDVQRIFNNTKKTYMVFDEVSKLWRGRLYIPETAFNKPTEGGAL